MPDNLLQKAAREIAIKAGLDAAKAFSEYNEPEPEPEKIERQKIHAVVIIGLYSGERIMKDIFSEAGLQEEIKILSCPPKNNTGYFFGTYYMNGQRHVLCQWINTERIESISYTLTGETQCSQ